MCGIAGIVNASEANGSAPAMAARMAAVLAHRGPDDEGCWAEPLVALGHRRLSIIDLTPAGRQPMVDQTGRYVLVYNGEIYNYRELREELAARGHRFRSATDSEVLLCAYREWGAAALARLNGMWAFAIWDRERRELFAARDRAGKKPFYFATDATGNLYFASEIKALRAAGLRFGIAAQAAFDFLTQGTYGHLGETGFFDGVRQLPAGHFMVVRPGEEPVLTRYWRLPAIPDRDRLPYDETFRSRFRDLLTDAVRLRLRADVQVGATLSGGLDSSTIVLLMDRIRGGEPLHLFTSLYPGSVCDESPYFEAVAARVRRPVVHRVTPPAAQWREQLLRVLDHQEEPFGDTSIVAHYHLMEASRAEGVPVILSGQGGDELLLGYPSLVQAYLGSLLAGGRVAEAVREIRRWSRGVGSSTSRVMRAAIAHSVPLPLRDRMRQRFVRGRAAMTTPRLRGAVSFRRFAATEGRTSIDSYISQMFTRFSLPHLTHYDDRNAMAFGVEGRMPFLDHRLVELVFNVRREALFHNGFTKRVLRESFDDLLPEVVRQRRDKIGFYTPLAAWLRGSEAWIRGFMTRDRMEHVGVLRHDWYAPRLSALLRGDHSAELDVWRGFVFHLWADRFDLAPLGWSGRDGSVQSVSCLAS